MKTPFNIFVTGGAGYIGSFVVQNLLKAGHKVVVFDNLTTGFREGVPSQAKFIEGDIRDATILENIFSENKIDAIMHFAAKTVVPDSVRSPLDYYDNNFVGSLTLLQSAMKAKISKFMFSSTAAVYAPSSDGLVNETSATGPTNPYGTSKLFFENALQEVRSSDPLDYVILRYFNVAGAALDVSNGQRTKGATHLIKVASELACKKRNVIQIYGDKYETPDGTAVRDYIHIEDLADAHVLALDRLMNTSCGEIYNVGYGHGSSVLEVISRMEKVVGHSLEKQIAPPREGDQAQVVADSARIKSQLGWKPKFADLETICKTAYEWEKKQP